MGNGFGPSGATDSREMRRTWELGCLVQMRLMMTVPVKDSNDSRTVQQHGLRKSSSSMSYLMIQTQKAAGSKSPCTVETASASYKFSIESTIAEDEHGCAW